MSDNGTPQTIVVGTDGSETAAQAVKQAVQWAKTFDASLHVVTAFKPMRGAKIGEAPSGAAKVWQPHPDDAAQTTLDQAVASGRFAGVSTEGHLVEDEPADALLGVARQVSADLIVIGSQGMSGARRVLGSVPNTISHQAHCNVMIVATSG